MRFSRPILNFDRGVRVCVFEEAKDQRQVNTMYWCVIVQECKYLFCYTINLAQNRIQSLIAHHFSVDKKKSNNFFHEILDKMRKTLLIWIKNI